MKPLKESFIKAKDLDKLNRWPNPYNLTEKDQKGYLKNVPLEITTLMLKEIQLQKGEEFTLEDLQIWDVDGAFQWDNTKDGHIFWRKICDKDYQVFYDKYTPEKLRKRLKEE